MCVRPTELDLPTRKSRLTGNPRPKLGIRFRFGSETTRRLSVTRVEHYIDGVGMGSRFEARPRCRPRLFESDTGLHVYILYVHVLIHGPCLVYI